jgi:hypothetical protein
MKSLPLKKTQDRPCLNVAMLRVMYHDNASMGVRDVHLPAGGWLLNTRRVSVPLVPRPKREQRDEILLR